MRPLHRVDAAAGTTDALPDLGVDDLPDVLAAFYDAVARSPLLAPYFAGLDMTSHIPRIADFWATVAFSADRYQRNVFRPHLEMPGLSPAHFAEWLALLGRTVDSRHAGPAAERTKAMAERIAYSMQRRLGLQPCTPCAPTGARVHG
jgi:hemoglobin